MEKQLQVTVIYVFEKVKEKPHLEDWWSNMETKHKSKFRTNRPDYIKLVDLSQKNFETELDDTHFSCFCHD
jgi:hypothetical protein